MDEKILKILKDLGIEAEPTTAEQITEARNKVAEAGNDAIANRQLDRAKELAAAVETLNERKAEVAKQEEANEKELTELSSRFKVEEAPEAEAPKEEPKEEKPKEEPEAEVKSEEKEKVEAEPAQEQPKAEDEPKEAPVADNEEVEKVAADAKPKAKMPSPPESHRPITTKPAVMAAFTAAADLKELAAGQPIGDLKVMASAAARKAEAVMRPGVSGSWPVANAKVDYPKDRQLSMDAEENTSKIDAVQAAAIEQTNDELRKLRSLKGDDLYAVTADGGLCAPVNVSYDQFGVGSEVRPIRDGLTRFQATRGGIRFVPTPTLADLAGAVSVYTEAQDTAGDTDKPCLTVTCESATEEVVDAITKCLEIGNFAHRTFIERFNRFWQLAGVQHAKEAETQLWDRIVANSTAVTAGQNFGASRDIPENLIQASTAMRSRHRVPRSTPVRWILPDWVIELMAVDRLRQLPGDDAYIMTEADFRRELAAHNIALTLTPDAGQEFQAQVAGPLAEWFQTVEAVGAFEGTHLFLDQGTLDFGLVRDSTLNASNNLQMMMETFEGTAMVGVESMHLTMTVCPEGSSSGTIDATCDGS